MGPAGAIKIVNKAELAAASDREAVEKELVEKYKDEIANPFKAEELGMIDDVIKPSKTRQVLITAFDILANKQYSQPERKHGNIPL
jgi:acetyl-CoA carboxylase carboxyltransferase component